MSTLKKLVSEAAKAKGIEPEVFAALIYQESRGRIYAYRFEPGFYERYIFPQWENGWIGFMPEGVPVYEEAFRRSASYGLTQVMGQVAREMGFKNPDLRDLYDPQTNLDYGAQKFADCFQKTQDLRKALLRYNGGGDAKYPEDVQRWIGSSEIRFLVD